MLAKACIAVTLFAGSLFACAPLHSTNRSESIGTVSRRTDESSSQEASGRLQRVPNVVHADSASQLEILVMESGASRHRGPREPHAPQAGTRLIVAIFQDGLVVSEEVAGVGDRKRRMLMGHIEADEVRSLRNRMLGLIAQLDYDYRRAPGQDGVTLQITTRRHDANFVSVFRPGDPSFAIDGEPDWAVVLWFRLWRMCLDACSDADEPLIEDELRNRGLSDDLRRLLGVPELEDWSVGDSRQGSPEQISGLRPAAG